MHARQVTNFSERDTHEIILRFFLLFFLFFLSFSSFKLNQRKNVEFTFNTSIFHFGNLGTVILVDREQILQFEGSICEVSGFNLLPDIVTQYWLSTQ